MTSQLTSYAGTMPEQVLEYYARKMPEVISKYGPGPRIHFHLGLYDPQEPPSTLVDRQVLQRRLVAAQENMLEYAARAWGALENPPQRLLDVGCGLAGGALFWAQRLGCEVTAVTNMPEHVQIAKDLVAEAGLSHLVTPVLMDAQELDLPVRYDAAVAFESVCHMERERVFPAVAASLRPGGWFAMEDHFLLRPDWRAPIDGYYKTNLSTLKDYVEIAAASGFTLEADEDITARVTEFWMQSYAWATAALDEPGTSEEENGALSRHRLTESAAAHGRFYRAWRDGAAETRLLLFRLSGRVPAAREPRDAL